MYKSIYKSEDGVFETLENEQGRTYTIKHKKPFPEWIETNYSSYQNFLTLKTQDKERIFLKYKHGLETDHMNLSLEINERRLMRDMISPEDIAEDGHYASRKAFDSYCYEVKKEIGLVATDEQIKTRDMVSKVFGGKVERGSPIEKEDIPF